MSSWGRALVVGLVVLVGALEARAQQTDVVADRAAIGASVTSTGSPLVLGTLPARSSGAGVLSRESDGRTSSGSLVKADLPAVVGYTDTAQTWLLGQTFSSGATFSSTVAVSGLATLTGGFSSGAASSVTGTFGVSGLSTLTGGFSSGAASSVTGTFGVSGLSTLTGGYSAGASSSIAGNLTLTGSGNVTAAGDVAVNGGDLTASAGLTLRPGGSLTLDPVGDVVMGPDGADVLPASGYAVNLGALGSKYLALHAAELWVETLVAQDTIATIGGRILVGPTTQLTADLSAGATSITVKHNNLANGDRVYLEAAGAVEFLAITSAASGSAGAWSYSVTRNLDGTGANAWSAGDAVFNTGQTGSGFIDLYSVRGVKAGSEAGPTIVGNVRQSATYNDWAPRWAVGNLSGLYGYASTEYGAAFGAAAGQHVTIEPTNGVRFRSGANTWAQLSGAGLALGVTAAGNGNIFADTSGNLYLRSGMVARLTMSAANGSLSLIDDDGATVRAQIGPTSATFGSLDKARIAVDYDANVRAFNGSGKQFLQIDPVNGMLLGDWYTANASYLQMWPDGSQMAFCRNGGTSCPLVFSGSTGDISSYGNILLASGGNISSTGNFSITQASGIKLETSSTSGGSGGDAARRLWFPGGGSIYGPGDDVVVSTITASSGSPTVQLYAQRGACGASITCVAYFDVIPSTSTATTPTQFVFSGSQTTGVGEAYYELIRGEGAGTLRLGSSTYYLGAIHWNGAQTTGAHYPMVWDGSDYQFKAKSNGKNGSCMWGGSDPVTLVIEYGVIVNCY